MSLEEAFLRDVGEDPDDDAPRLAYADWLQEQADAARQARGEFIALQCAIAREEGRGPQREGRKKRTRALLRQHRRDWLPLPLGLIYAGEFHRGFLERVTLDGNDLPRYAFIDGASELFCREPAVRHLRLAPVWDTGSNRPLLLDLFALPAWPPLVTLALEDNRLDHEAVRTLVASPQLRGIRRLLLAGNRIQVEGAWALAESVHLADLEALTFSQGGIGMTGVMLLARSPHLGRLLFLGVSDDHIDYSGLEDLARSATLVSLRGLQLRRCLLGAREVRALLAGPLLSQLRRLDLSENHDLDDEALRPLLESAEAAGLEELVLRDCSVSDEGQQRFRDRFGDRVHL